MVHVRPQEIVDSALALARAGMPDADNARRHGVAIKTIRRWRRHYLELGLPRGQTHLSAGCPRCDDAPLDLDAYAELLGWYLGDGWIENRRNGAYALHIYNDVRYTALNRGLQETMRRVKPGCRPHVRHRPGCLITTVSWRHWPCLFPQHGPGRKHERPLTLEPWQEDVLAEHPGPFLRGLFHSDGARTNNWASRTRDGVTVRYDYPRWQFVNHSPDIRRWCTEALDRLGVPWRASNWKTVSVSRREGVALLDDVVGPKH